MMYAATQPARARTPRGTPTPIPILEAVVRPEDLDLRCFVLAGDVV